MKNYKITVSYDGTRYKGWQVLKSTEATTQIYLASLDKIGRASCRERV